MAAGTRSSSQTHDDQPSRARRGLGLDTAAQGRSPENMRRSAASLRLARVTPWLLNGDATPIRLRSSSVTCARTLAPVSVSCQLEYETLRV